MAARTAQQQRLRDVLTDYATFYGRHAHPGVEQVLALDDEHGQYLWIETGWDQQRRVQQIVVHARTHATKIWIEEDWTEDGIATALLRVGVPATDIVLAFYGPTALALHDSLLLPQNHLLATPS